MAATGRSRASQHWSFARKTGYILTGAACGWIACYWYVTQYGGVMPKPGTGSTLVKEIWTTFKPILIPIIVAAVSSYIHKRKREGDR